MKNFLNKYALLCVMLILLLILFMVEKKMAIRVIKLSSLSVKEMLMVIPPIFLMLGLLDTWVSKEKMARFMGKGSGLKGILLALFIGSAAAGPLYGAFPVASVLMKKGVKFSNILIFIGAWSTTKLPMFLFEMVSMGKKFAILRLLIDIPGIIIIANLLIFFLKKTEIEQIYKNNEQIGA